MREETTPQEIGNFFWKFNSNNYYLVTICYGQISDEGSSKKEVFGDARQGVSAMQWPGVHREGEENCRTRTIRISKEEVMCRSRRVTNLLIKNTVFLA
jgi:hypothetical protein